MDIDEGDVIVDTFRGPSNDCAVRITHVPTGTVISVTHFETVPENRKRALLLLREALGATDT